MSVMYYIHQSVIMHPIDELGIVRVEVSHEENLVGVILKGVDQLREVVAE